MTSPLALPPLDLGPDVLRLLLPHRRPFVMVDGVTGFARAPRVALTAYRHVSANEPVFEGHFPGLHLWPGVLTIEGLGQACNVALVLGALCAGAEGEGAREEDVLGALRDAQARARRGPLAAADLPPALAAALARPAWNLGVSAHVDVKLLAPVYAGSRLDYRVVHTHEVGDMLRFEVAAEVGGRAVARGHMTAARLGQAGGAGAP